MARIKSKPVPWFRPPEGVLEDLLNPPPKPAAPPSPPAPEAKKTPPSLNSALKSILAFAKNTSTEVTRRLTRSRSSSPDENALPEPVQALKASAESEPVETPSESFSSAANASICPHCGSIPTDMSIQDFQDHVASCTRPSTASSDSTSSILSPPPASPSLASNGAAAAAAARINGKNHSRSSVLGLDAKGDGRDVASQVAVNGDAPRVAKVASENVENEAARINVEFDREESDDDDDNDYEQIHPYTGGLTWYEYPKLSQTPDEQKEVNEEENGNGLDEVDVPEESKEYSVSQPNGLHVPQSGEISAESELLTDSEAPKIPESNLDRFSFLELTPVEDVEKFLADPEKMSYEELYHRTSEVAHMLATYQEEFDKVNQKYKDFETAENYKKQCANEDAREAARIRQEADDIKLAEVYTRFKPILGYQVQGASTAKAWLEKKIWLEKYEKENPKSKDIEWLRQLTEMKSFDSFQKRQRALENAQKKPKLINGDLPPLTKKDHDEVNLKRKRSTRILQDKTTFEDKKMADVYGFIYNPAQKYHGDQVLGYLESFPKNSKDSEKERDDEVVIIGENGRPKRQRTKKNYDTDNDNTAPPSDAEELPAKRRRTQKVLDSDSGAVGRPQSESQSRDATPAPRVFASGKRVGRPPGSKTMNTKKPPQSKLKNVHVPSPSASDAENDDGTQGGRELPAAEEAELQAAAESLVAKASPVLRKHPGGRPKKKATSESFTAAGSSDILAKEELIEPVAAGGLSKPKNKGGRPRKHPIPDAISSEPAKAKPTRSSRLKNEPLGDIMDDADELMPSTEFDDESRFASASTSRPSTSSSGATTSTFGPRRSRRTGTRDNSKIPESASNEITTNSTKGRKRKRGAAKNIKAEELGNSDENGTIRVDTDYLPAGLDDPVSHPKKRRTRVEKQPSNGLSTAAAGGEATTTGGRPKRKRTAVNMFESSSVDPDGDQEGGRPKRKRTIINMAESSSDEIEDDTEDVKPKRKRTVANMAESSVDPDIGRDDDNAGAGGDPFGIYDATPPPPRQKIVPPAVAAPIMKTKVKKRPAPAKTPINNDAEDEKTDEEVYRGLSPASAELLRKKRQKSKKLSKATKARWERGAMDAPMKKRRETNAAKKAAKATTSTTATTASTNTGAPISAPNPAPILPPVSMVSSMPALAPLHIAPAHVPLAAAPIPISAPPIPITSPPIPIAAAPIPIAAAPIPVGSALLPINMAPAPAPIIAPKPKASRIPKAPGPPPPPPTRVSTRVKFPTRARLGLDGASDEYEEEYEYESFF